MTGEVVAGLSWFKGKCRSRRCVVGDEVVWPAGMSPEMVDLERKWGDGRRRCPVSSSVRRRGALIYLRLQRSSVKVFRCQLPRSNRFYTYEFSDHNGKVKAALCSWCRTWKGCSVCGNCKRARYCSKKHQAAHWRKGHKFECRKLAVDRQHINSSFVASNTVWPQFKIRISVEPKDATMSENGGYATALSSAGSVDEGFNPLLYNFEADADQKNWATFQERVLRVPEQVLRYCSDAGARPLWPMSSVRPSETDVPICCYCGGPRCFEFQIMPQLLYYFGVQNDVNSLDWSTIVIYTCEASCDGSMAYKEEFAWVQLP